MNNNNIVTCIAPVNIAVIKYCKYIYLTIFFLFLVILIFLFLGGKRDDDLILPVNDSISLSLDTKQVNCNFIYCFFFILF